MEEKNELKLSLGTAVFLIILIIILALILSIKIIKSNKRESSNLSKNEEIITDLSLSDIKDTLNKSKSITNYKCNYLINGQEATEKYKDNKASIETITESGRTAYYYLDYDKNTVTIINKDKKIAIITSEKEKQENTLTRLNKEILEYIENSEYSIEEENVYNNKDCIVIKINQIYNNEGWLFETISSEETTNLTYTIWIDKETGAILKYVAKSDNQEYIMEYKYEFNCVTDEDIKEPDLTGYNVIEQ